MTPPVVKVTRIGEGHYLVERDGANEIVYAAGAAADRWIFWNGEVFHGDFRPGRPQGAQLEHGPVPAPAAAHTAGTTSLIAPMPARVGRIAVERGSRVRKGDAVVVLEAMKMELPIRAPQDAVVTAVHCREGELVEADFVLVELA